MDITGVVERESQNSGLAQFLEGLDEKSRSILYYLWWHRYAGIAELRNSVENMDDYEVLQRLKEVINRKSRDLWGKPLVSFEQAKIDPITGEKVLFSWWYLGEDEMLLLGKGSGLVDVFDEKDNVTIIAQLPVPVDLTDPEIRVKNGILRIAFKKTGHEQYPHKIA
jgi:hypothetical protein